MQQDDDVEDGEVRIHSYPLRVKNHDGEFSSGGALPEAGGIVARSGLNEFSPEWRSLPAELNCWLLARIVTHLDLDSARVRFAFLGCQNHVSDCLARFGESFGDGAWKVE
jgi:hypothetical protein